MIEVEQLPQVRCEELSIRLQSKCKSWQAYLLAGHEVSADEAPLFKIFRLSQVVDHDHSYT